MSKKIFFQRRNFSLPDNITGSNGVVYDLDIELGRGGNAVVFECANQANGDVFAVKLLLSNYERERFETEMYFLEVVASYGNPHLIKYIDRGVTTGTEIDRNKKNKDINVSFVVMERAACSLSKYVVDNEVSSEVYIAQFRGLIKALGLLHLHAIHRDLKPENILVVGERWVISDLGICYPNDENQQKDLTRHGKAPGPKFWMSPEANNKHVGMSDEICFASDVFQLAAIFWWVVNRRHPSGILTVEDWSGVESLFEPISKALQHSLARRYTSTTEFEDAFQEALGF